MQITDTLLSHSLPVGLQAVFDSIEGFTRYIVFLSLGEYVWHWQAVIVILGSSVQLLCTGAGRWADLC